MLCSSSFSIGRVAAAGLSSTLSPSSSANSSLKHHKYNCEKDLLDPQQEKPSRNNRGNFFTKRLFPSSSSKRMTDEEMSVVQKSIESRSQRSRRSGGITSKADINNFLNESSRRYRPATRLTSVASLESTASDLLAPDRAQANGTWFGLIRPVITCYFPVHVLDVRHSWICLSLSESLHSFPQQSSPTWNSSVWLKHSNAMSSFSMNRTLPTVLVVLSLVANAAAFFAGSA